MPLVRRTVTFLSALFAILALAVAPATADPGPAPSRMASMGDSITRGFNACGWF